MFLRALLAVLVLAVVFRVAQLARVWIRPPRPLAPRRRPTPLLGTSRSARQLTPPTPPAAARRPIPDCSIPGGGAPVINSVDASTTGGYYSAPSLTIAQGTVIKLKRDLIIVVEQRLQIDGTIEYDRNLPGPAPNIVLASRLGDVIIGASGVLGSVSSNMSAGPAPVSVTARNARAFGTPGRNSGYIKVVAEQGAIDVQGRISGYFAEDGGNATATGRGVAGFLGFGGRGGSAASAGGQAGAGGHVRLCAYDAINIDGAVDAGVSGEGGLADATADRSRNAVAQGGPGNHGGDVFLEGLDPSCQVFLSGEISAGNSQPAGAARATAGGNFGWGGDAKSWGGHGFSGSTVHFIGCAVQDGFSGSVNGSRGGNGGAAMADGGTGESAVLFFGEWGGNAEAEAGPGGTPGAVPQIPLVSGATAQGTIVVNVMSDGAGGNASATGGTGGQGGRAGNQGFGGQSGTGSAVGGRSGNTGRVAVPGATGPVPGAPGPFGLGGVCPTASSNGMP